MNDFNNIRSETLYVHTISYHRCISMSYNSIMSTNKTDNIPMGPIPKSESTEYADSEEYKTWSLEVVEWDQSDVFI